MLGRMVMHGLAVLLAVAAWAGSAEARSLDEIIKAGVLRIGVNPSFPPNSSYNDRNQLEGFDIDVGNKIAEGMKLDAEYVPTETRQRVPFLVADKIDISLGALTRSAERCCSSSRSSRRTRPCSRSRWSPSACCRSPTLPRSSAPGSNPCPTSRSRPAPP